MLEASNFLKSWAFDTLLTSFFWYLRGWLIDPNYRYNDVPRDEDATILFQKDLGDYSL